MAYTKQTWADSDPSKPVSAARMGHVEDGIEATAIVADGAATQASSALSGSTANTTKITDMAGAWRPWFERQGIITGLATGTYVMGSSNSSVPSPPSAFAQYIGGNPFYFDPADYAVSGFTQKLRWRGHVTQGSSTQT